MEAITVSQLNRYVVSILESNVNLSNIKVLGEISSMRKYSSGHLYFTIKDENSAVSCVMFRGNTTSLDFNPEDGCSVIITGKASLYERDGKFQIYVNSMKEKGVGDLFAAFEKLKEKLQNEGLFDLSKKKKIPFMPKRIGVVTSADGAVIRDIINVLERRFPNFNLLLYPVQVQGDLAFASLVEGIKYFNESLDIDVIIIGRGGGSIEDLWAFNNETLARTVFESKIPVISAVGHETDFTICDFVADLRAPTPSAAAELVMPLKSDIVSEINKYKRNLVSNLKSKFKYEKIRLKHFMDSRVYKSPKILFEQHKQSIDIYQDKLIKHVDDLISRRKDKLMGDINKLDSLSPLKTLQRGYAIVNKSGDNNPIISINNININDRVLVTLKDGKIDCSVKSIHKGDLQ